MIGPPPHDHVWGPCIVKGGVIRKRLCQVKGCYASTSC